WPTARSPAVDRLRIVGAVAFRRITLEVAGYCPRCSALQSTGAIREPAVSKPMAAAVPRKPKAAVVPRKPKAGAEPGKPSAGAEQRRPRHGGTAQVVRAVPAPGRQIRPAHGPLRHHGTTTPAESRCAAHRRAPAPPDGGHHADPSSTKTRLHPRA